MPRTVFAAPVYENARHVEQALRSILAQTDPDLALLVLDDGSADGTAQIAQRLAEEDDRVVVRVNPQRLGMLENTRQAWHVARELWPEAEQWALASDHDVWDRDWLVTLRRLLEARPEAVLAYPRSRRIDDHGNEIRRTREWRCDTTGIADPVRRMRHAYRHMVAGDMIYGLFRADTFARVGPYRDVLVPDRLLLADLALRGEFAQADRVLWRRRYVGLADLERQRRAFWPEGAPATARHVPWWVAHATLTWREGRRRFAVHLLLAGARLRVLRRRQALRRRVGALLERPARAGLRFRAAQRVVEAGALPVPAETTEVLRRLLAERRRSEERYD